jgi:cytochrome c-type biogenesis protein CcmH
VNRIFLVAAIFISGMAAGNEELEQRVMALSNELRCLVCQNQTLADSNAPLAVDLRNQIRGQIGQGRTDDQIRDYMVERYGDFVLYKPPFHAGTAVLWLGPPLLIATGLGIFLLVVRRRPQAEPAAELPARRRKELEALMQDKKS